MGSIITVSRIKSTFPTLGVHTVATISNETFPNRFALYQPRLQAYSITLIKVEYPGSIIFIFIKYKVSLFFSLSLQISVMMMSLTVCTFLFALSPYFFLCLYVYINHSFVTNFQFLFAWDNSVTCRSFEYNFHILPISLKKI
ncbi:uncharacterized protein BYT42DRAFT_415143 [Radiomyces spectabilis]|uniref:uncharacterized protein n=1 Tax=Radiomyces spectabilis TaxID=64574 RepID=UPI00221EF1A7|nr:uncharacterized protein BYT42DRAFT_415143 [Radiomyces spectabilis]KAI8374671.1 hypothetical protein BYT42DRAFT_415143 [Radiomyces spectabilis]